MDRKVTGYRCLFTDCVYLTEDLAEFADRLYVGRVVSELLNTGKITVAKLLKALNLTDEQAVALFKSNCDKH